MLYALPSIRTTVILRHTFCTATWCLKISRALFTDMLSPSHCSRGHNTEQGLVKAERRRVTPVLQARQQRLSHSLQRLWSDVPAWTATLLFMFQPVAQSVSSYVFGKYICNEIAHNKCFDCRQHKIAVIAYNWLMTTVDMLTSALTCNKLSV